MIGFQPWSGGQWVSVCIRYTHAFGASAESQRLTHKSTNNRCRQKPIV